MLDIHDIDTIKQKFDDHACWLDGVEIWRHDNYMVATLVRIQQAFLDLNGNNQTSLAYNDLDRFATDAAAYFSGGPNKHSDDYAYEVVRHARIGVSMNNKRLLKIFEDMEKEIGHEILWVFPFMDFDLHFSVHVPFIQNLIKFNVPNMVLLLIRDVAELSAPLEKANVIIGMDGDELQNLVEETTPLSWSMVKTKMAPPPPPPKPAPAYSGSKYFPVIPPYEDEEDCQQEDPKPPQPKYRSIDDE